MSYRFKDKPVIDCNGTVLKEGQIVSYPGRRRSRMYMNVGRISYVYPVGGHIRVQRRIPDSLEFSEKHVLIHRTDRVSVLAQPTPITVVGKYGGLTFEVSSLTEWSIQQKLNMEGKEYQKAVEQWKKEQAEVRRLCTCKLSNQKNDSLIWGGLPHAHQTL